uniref:Sugar phosphate transporter domain-containing protein n=1 Tax=Neobodo designis TaxID=312471 RepID=A0A7S1M311_NEODS|mmetsp:Transcript_33310/g.102875  ORF Transcript_33310/g.102875 Transcript_33310/m.102875 type:complete len:394 (+) Transcript_33310:115-1296(+)|eukprot:CAMPEP_0174851830 /NCGR_PEP_ID=MMETSP1114-20130205/24080_1 /TAXON_ID=312471 /ORGANISM="Neobodo designis, Strain CCAP 1951/1" /LENGTH=393 /DNA_ID=CAMNT_0016086389 /DNA_START=113 /DNA_END=1294 /DNA_ORIENTATION=-
MTRASTASHGPFPPIPQPKMFGVSQSAFACGLTIVISTMTLVHNKYVLQHVFQSSDCLLLVQNALVLLFVLFARRAGWIADFELSFTRNDVWSGTLNTLNVMTGMWALSRLSVPIYSTVKRCTPVVSWLIELCFDRKPTTMQALGPILAMLTATLFTGHFDGQFTLVGYVLGFASCVTQAGAFEMGKRAAGGANKGVWSVLLSNATVALVVQTAYLVGSGEIAQLSPSQLSGNAVFHLALNSVSCIVLNYAIYLNCTVNSPLAHAVTGNIKAAFATLFGVLLLDKPLGAMAWAGITFNFGGAAWFSWVKMRGKAAPASSRPGHLRRSKSDEEGDESFVAVDVPSSPPGSPAAAGSGAAFFAGSAHGARRDLVEERAPRSWNGTVGRRRVFAWA